MTVGDGQFRQLLDAFPDVLQVTDFDRCLALFADMTDGLAHRREAGGLLLQERMLALFYQMQLDAIPLINALFCEVNPIPVKAALNLMGKEVGPLRLPLTEMEPQNQERLAKAMKDFGIKLA